MALALTVAYLLFAGIFQYRHKGSAHAFFLAGLGWLQNFVYLIIRHVIAPGIMQQGAAQLWEVSFNSLGSLFFLMAASERLRYKVPVFQKRKLIGTLCGLAILLPFVEKHLGARLDVYSILRFFDADFVLSVTVSVLLSSVAIFAIAYAYQTYFEETRHQFPGTTKVAVVFSLYAYSGLQFGYLYQVVQPLAGFPFVDSAVFFWAAVVLKSIHLSGLLNYGKGIFQDYEKKRKAFRDSQVRGDLFDQLAHELTTPATELRLRIENIAVSAELNEASEREYAKMLALAERILNHIKIFKDYKLPRPGSLVEAESANANLLCDKAILAFKFVARPKMKIERRYCQKPHVQVRVNEFHQVITNVLKNAYEATGELEDARLIVATEILPAARGTQAVRIKFLDNGPGIAENILGLVFEDGFSTKAGEGRGHGLAICRTIIEGHDGVIVASASGDSGISGGCIEIDLPYVAESDVVKIGD